jgi:hypothetical protein
VCELLHPEGRFSNGTRSSLTVVCRGAIPAKP